MQKVILSRKCLRFFKRTFASGHFNAQQFQADYKALFSHVYKELYKFGNVEYSSAQVLKDMNEASKLFDVLEPYVKAVFDYYGEPYPKELLHGGMDKTASDKFLQLLIKENKYKIKTEKQEAKPAVKPQEKVEEKPTSSAHEKKSETPKKAEQSEKADSESPVKREDVLVFHDRKSFETMFALAEYKYGQPNEKNRSKVCKYIAGFSLKKDEYLEDAVGETLSDEHGAGGKKKYSVLDKSVWFELNQTFHFYINVFHLYDDVYYPELYAKRQKEGGLANFFKGLFGLNDEEEEKEEELPIFVGQKNAEPVIETDEDMSLDLENTLKSSVSQKQNVEVSKAKTTEEPNKEIEPLTIRKKK